MKPWIARLSFALLAALGLAPPLAWAERADRDKPMNIEADAMRYDDKAQASTFTGRVVVTKGTILMRGDRLDVQQDQVGNQSGTMTADGGKRVFFRQKREGLNECIEGEAAKVFYDGRTDLVRMTDRAEMRRYQGSALVDQIQGAVIVYNNVTEVITVDGAPGPSAAAAASPRSAGRVRATLAPRGPAPAATPAPAAPLRTGPAPGERP